jgi:hypothetical protein
MKNAITSAECWGYDVFDIAIRRLQQLDRGMYPANIIYRVLMESDFAVNPILYNIIFSTFLQNNMITGSIYNVLNFHWFFYVAWSYWNIINCLSLCSGSMVLLEHFGCFTVFPLFDPTHTPPTCYR